jgi:hypothetical protein
MSRLVIGLLRDETATTTVEYVVTAVGVVLIALGATRMIVGLLVSYLHRVYAVVTLPVL